MKPYVRLSFLVAMGFAATLRAQDFTGTLSISGSVLGSNGVPLPYSTVSIQESGIERFANERGDFILAGLIVERITGEEARCFDIEAGIAQKIPIRAATEEPV